MLQNSCEIEAIMLLLMRTFHCQSTFCTIRAVILSPGDILQCLKTFSIVTTGSKVGGRDEGDVTSIKRVEARNGTKHSTMHWTVPYNKDFQPKM